MAYVIQQTVVNGFADVAYRPLGIGWCDDLVRAGSVLIGSENANLSPGHLFFMDVHRLWRNETTNCRFVNEIKIMFISKRASK